VVYGVVALLVKADDVGVALAKNDRGSAMGGISRAFGRALVFGMPGLLIFLRAAGTAAMILVGGGIIVHGLEAYGLHFFGQAINSAAEAAARALPSAAGAVKWIVAAVLFVGLSIGAAAIPVIGFAFAPAWNLLKGILGGRQQSRCDRFFDQTSQRGRIVKRNQNCNEARQREVALIRYCQACGHAYAARTTGFSSGRSRRVEQEHCRRAGS
jgi:hypothetical protein